MACRALLEHMEAGTWATVLDVRNFYPTCDADALATMLAGELHLRPAMVRAALCDSAMRLQPGAKRGGRPPRKPARQRRRFYLINPRAARACQTAGGEGKGGVPPKEEANPSVSPGDVTPALGAHVPYRNGLPFGNDAGGCQPRRQTKTKTKPAGCRRGLPRPGLIDAHHHCHVSQPPYGKPHAGIRCGPVHASVLLKCSCGPWQQGPPPRVLSGRSLRPAAAAILAG